MTTKEYQTRVFKILQSIFGVDLVRQEWDSLQYDGHGSYNKQITYSPRLDLAVGPFNGLTDLDLGVDQTKSMKKHPLTKRLFKDAISRWSTLDEAWKPTSRCYLAIEIEHSGSSKHIMGDIINVCASGSLGILVVNNKNYEKANRIYKYLNRLIDFERFDMNGLKNLIIFKDSEFIKVIAEIKQKEYGRKN